MHSLMTEPALRSYALAGTIVALHLIVLALWTGATRAMRKTFVNPEDAKLNKTAVAEDDHADVLRVKRAHQNALENAIPFFAIGLLYALTSPRLARLRSTSSSSRAPASSTPSSICGAASPSARSCSSPACSP